MNLIELNAKAFDTLVQIEQLQLQLRQLNQAIADEAAKLVEVPAA